MVQPVPLSGSNGAQHRTQIAAALNALIASVQRVPAGQPNFSAYLASTQSVTSSAFTKVLFDTVEWDTGSYFDKTTNHRFTPKVAGTYLITLGVYGAGTGVSLVDASIYKNGAEWKRAGDAEAGGTTVAVSALVQLNGTTDYIEGWGRVTGTSPTFLAGETLTWMQGYRIGP